MAKRTLWLMGMWLGALTAAQTADMLVAVYVGGQRVPMQPAAWAPLLKKQGGCGKKDKPVLF